MGAFHMILATILIIVLMMAYLAFRSCDKSSGIFGWHSHWFIFG